VLYGTLHRVLRSVHIEQFQGVLAPWVQQVRLAWNQRAACWYLWHRQNYGEPAGGINGLRQFVSRRAAMARRYAAPVVWAWRIHFW
jgi:hypothetical protein